MSITLHTQVICIYRFVSFQYSSDSLLKSFYFFFSGKMQFRLSAIIWTDERSEWILGGRGCLVQLLDWIRIEGKFPDKVSKEQGMVRQSTCLRRSFYFIS